MNEQKLFAIFAILVLAAGCTELFYPKATPYIVQNWKDTQMKITYIGTQEKIVPSIGISVNEFDLDKFQDRFPGVDYSNDKLSMKTMRISEEEMKKTVNNVFALDFIENGEASGRSVSFTYYNATEATVKEFLLNEEQAKTLANTIKNSISTSSQAAPLEIYS